jgi:hypothetical protein
VKPPVLESDVRGGGFEQVRGDLLRALANGNRALEDRCASDRGAAASEGPDSARHDRGVAVEDDDVLEGNLESIGGDLGPARLVPLTVR